MVGLERGMESSEFIVYQDSSYTVCISNIICLRDILDLSGRKYDESPGKMRDFEGHIAP